MATLEQQQASEILQGIPTSSFRKLHTGIDVLGQVVDRCLVGVSVTELTSFGDDLILTKTAQFRTEGTSNGGGGGIAFPTSIGVDHILFNNTEDSILLQEGQVVKIKLGVHVDGQAVSATHTVIVRSSPEVTPYTDRHADVICASYFVLEASIKALQKCESLANVAAAARAAAKAFGCTLVAGGGIKHMSKNEWETGKKGWLIAEVDTPEGTKDSIEGYLEPGDVIRIELPVSTGDGKLKEMESLPATTVYQRHFNKHYNIKLKSSRLLLGQLTKHQWVFPFSSRHLQIAALRAGLKECVDHDLLQMFPVTAVQKGDLTACYSATLVISAESAQPILLSTLSRKLPYVHSAYEIPPFSELGKLLLS